MFRSVPAGSGGAGCEGAGRRMAARACVTLCRAFSSRPARAARAAPPAATPLTTRKRRRPGRRAAGRSRCPPTAARNRAGVQPVRRRGRCGRFGGCGVEPRVPVRRSGRALGWSRPGTQGRRRSLVRGADEPAKRERAHRRPEDRGHRVAERRVRAAQRGGQADRGEDHQAGVPVGQPAHRDHPDQRREDGQRDQDAVDQRRLVVRAERGDREVLHRRGSEVDRGLPDHDRRGALPRAQAGHELADAQGHGRGEHARGGPVRGLIPPGAPRGARVPPGALRVTWRAIAPGPSVVPGLPSPRTAGAR